MNLLLILVKHFDQKIANWFVKYIGLCYISFMEELQKEAKTIGVELNQKQIEQFDLYFELLSEWNKKFNLTAITDKKDIRIKHFLDSLTVVPHIPKDVKKIIDIGAGAGFPGVPIKIARPDLSLTLTDSVGKKVTFLTELASNLELTETKTFNCRAEDLGKDKRYRESYDMATARAVAYLPTLCEYVLPLVKVGGIFIAQKSLHDEKHTEISDAMNAIGLLGGEIEEVIKIDLPFTGERHLIVIKKVSPTPKVFPRANGAPKQDPL